MIDPEVTGSADITVIEDENGLVLLGDPADITSWLDGQGITSREFTSKTVAAAKLMGKGLQLGGEAMANSGRWVKLTEESAKIAAKTGNSLSGGVVRGAGGKIVKHVKFEDLGKMAVANPGMVAGVGGVMAQLALEQAMAEITDYLETIDKKLDDVLQEHKDSALADLEGIAAAITEAQNIRETTGIVGATTWSKVSQCGRGLARAQSHALRKINGLTEGLEQAQGAKDVKTEASKIQADLDVWLSIIASSIQLGDALAVVELERIMAESPELVTAHRAGITATRTQQMKRISLALEQLSARISTASALAAKQKLQHPFAPNAAARSLTAAANQLAAFSHATAIAAQPPRVIAPPSWGDAVRTEIDQAGEEITVLGQRASSLIQQQANSAASGAREIADGAADVVKMARHRLPFVGQSRTVETPPKRMDPGEPSS